MRRADPLPDTMQFGLDRNRDLLARLGGRERADALARRAGESFCRKMVADAEVALSRARTDADRERCERNLQAARKALANLNSRAIAAE